MKELNGVHIMHTIKNMSTYSISNPTDRIFVVIRCMGALEVEVGGESSIFTRISFPPPSFVIVQMYVYLAFSAT